MNFMNFQWAITLLLCASCKKNNPPAPIPVVAAFQFTPVASGTTQMLHDITFSNLNTGYAGGDGGIYKTTDGGTSWTRVGSTGVFTIAAVNDQVVYAGGFNGVLLKTSDGGTNWTSVATPVSTSGNHVWDVWALNETTVYISQGAVSGKIYKTINGGNSWTDVVLGGGGTPVTSIQFISDQTGFATTGDPGSLLKTTNGGTTWAAIISGVPNGLASLFFINGQTGYVGEHNGGIRKTTDGGSTWTMQSTGNSSALRKMHFASEQVGIAVGDNGTVLTTTDGGITWKKENSSGLSGFMEGVYMLNSHLGFIAGESGKIFKVTR